MKYFSMFSGIGYGILETWTEKNICVNTKGAGKLRTERKFWLWKELGITLRHQNRKKLRLPEIKHTVDKLGLKPWHITVASVPVVEKCKASFYALTISKTMARNTGKPW